MRATSSPGDKLETLTENPVIAQDLKAVREKVEESGARVLIVDPVVSMQSGISNHLADVSRDLNRLKGLAREFD